MPATLQRRDVAVSAPANSSWATLATPVIRLAWQLSLTDRDWRLTRLWLDPPAEVLALSGGEQPAAQSLHQLLRERLTAWTHGMRVDLGDIPIDLGPASAFRRRVTDACRRVPWGATVTYGQLAASVGHPTAARAVGRVMATNPVPIVVPCHRVLASSGQLRGFSAPGGIDTKERLLALERSA